MKYDVTGYHNHGFVAEYEIEARDEQDAIKAIKAKLQEMAGPWKIKKYGVKLACSEQFEKLQEG